MRKKNIFVSGEDSETATEDENDVQARILRKKEVYLQDAPRNSDTETGSETEVKNSESNNLKNNLSPSDSSKIETLTLTSDTNLSTDEKSATVDSAPTIPMPISSDENLPSDIKNLDEKSASVDSIPAIPTIICSEDKSFDEKSASIPSDKSINNSTEHLTDKADDSIKTDETNSSAILQDLTAFFDAKDLVDSINNTDIALPDAIPICENESEINVVINLPDLISSSPNLNKHFLSSENLFCQEIKEALDKPEPERPSVIVTAATPTTERLPDDVTIVEEQTKLSVPKETPPTSFDSLKQEVKQRRARNKVEVPELKVLPSQSAKKKFDEYFNAPRRNSVKKPSDDLRVDTKTNRVDSKDLMKYFASETKPSPKPSPKPEPKRASPNLKLDFSNTMFDKIESENCLESEFIEKTVKQKKSLLKTKDSDEEIEELFRAVSRNPEPDFERKQQELFFPKVSEMVNNFNPKNNFKQTNSSNFDAEQIKTYFEPKVPPQKPARKKVPQSQPSTPKPRVKNPNEIKKSFSMRLLRNASFNSKKRHGSMPPESETKSTKSSYSQSGESTVSSNSSSKNRKRLLYFRSNVSDSSKSADSSSRSDKSKKDKCLIS